MKEEGERRRRILITVGREEIIDERSGRTVDYYEAGIKTAGREGCEGGEGEGSFKGSTEGEILWSR